VTAREEEWTWTGTSKSVHHTQTYHNPEIPGPFNACGGRRSHFWPPELRETCGNLRLPVMKHSMHAEVSMRAGPACNSKCVIRVLCVHPRDLCVLVGGGGSHMKGSHLFRSGLAGSDTAPRVQRVGRTRVKERSTHARPGVHVQQCSAVLTAHLVGALVRPSMWSGFAVALLCRSVPFCAPSSSLGTRGTAQVASPRGGGGEGALVYHRRRLQTR